MRVINNKAKSLWDKLVILTQFQQLVVEARKAGGIPVDGFVNITDGKNWKTKLLKDEKKQERYFKVRFDILFFASLSGVEGIDTVIDHYVEYGKLSDDVVFNADTSGCQLIVFSEKHLKKAKEMMTPGLYLKIGEDSRPADIRLFLKQNEWFINSYHKLVGRKTQTKYKVSSTTERNKYILQLNAMTLEELKKISGAQVLQKISHIKIILKQQNIYLSEETIKSIIYRTNKKGAFKVEL